ncbi:Uncharacterised protein [Mycobacteroides abscessus subsp. abscessus]|nr:Uncharacterised protein [Mycobacteroides abscessus subsp. abscessus]
MLGDQRHRRDQQERIGDRNLRCLADGCFVAGAVDVIGAKHIGDEQSVETAALQQRGKVCPVGQVFVPPGLVVGVPP